MEELAVEQKPEVTFIIRFVQYVCTCRVLISMQVLRKYMLNNCFINNFIFKDFL